MRGAWLAALALGTATGPTGTVVVTNMNDNTATIIDAGSNRVLATLPTGEGPHEVAVSHDGRWAVVSNYGVRGKPGNTLTVIDLDRLAVDRTISLGSHQRPHGSAFYPGDTVLAVTSEVSQAVLLVDLRTNQVVGTAPTKGRASHMLALVPDGSRIFTSNIADGTVSEIDPRTRQMLRAFPVGRQNEGIAVSPDGKTVWSGSNGDSTVVIVDVTAGHAVDTLRGFGMPYRLAATADGKRVVITDPIRGQIWIVDAKMRKRQTVVSVPADSIVATAEVPGSASPEGVTVSRDGRWAFVTLQGRNRMVTVDVARGAITGWAPTGVWSDGIGYSPRVAGPKRAAALLMGRRQSEAAPSTVTIYRDEWGVPHLYSATEAGGYYGLGYAMAEDELEYVLTLVVLARGEAAAALGPAQVGSDYSSRLWRHAEESKAGFLKMAPELQRNYRAWVAGLTKWMSEHPDKTPAWAPKLEPWDPVAISRWLLWLAYQAGEGLADCRRGGIKLAAVDQAGLDARRSLASNEWVVAPWRTADNALMMLSDPHGEVNGQFVYEFRMRAGRLAMAGYAVGAMPLLVQTDKVAWGMTTGAPDVSDCYEIDVDPAHPRRFQFDGKPQEMIVRSTTIPVKGAAPVTRVMEYTRHNGILSPVVARAGTKAYVVSTPYMPDAGVFDDELYRMVQGRNAAEVRDAMHSLGMFPQNVMVGDAEGHSFYVRAGKAPKRPAGFDWKKPVPGNTSATAWLGIHPLEDLVQIQDPPTGYMQNNNISPDQMFIGSPLTADRYPADVFNDVPGRTNSRARRAVEALSQAYRFTVADAISLALDEKWMDTDRWQLALRRSLDRQPARAAAMSATARTMIDRILRFDGQARAESVAALDFWYWRAAIGMGAGAFPYEVVEPAFLASDTIRADLAGRILDAVDSAVATMTRRHGGIDRPFGDVFRIGRGGASSYPVGGAGLVPDKLDKCESLASWSHVCVMTLRAFTPSEPDSLGRRHAVIGSRLLRLTVFTNPIQSFTIHNFGQSSDPASPHYDDQARELTSKRTVKPVYFDKSALLPHVKSERTLEVPPL